MFSLFYIINIIPVKNSALLLTTQQPSQSLNINLSCRKHIFHFTTTLIIFWRFFHPHVMISLERFQELTDILKITYNILFYCGYTCCFWKEFWKEFLAHSFNMWSPTHVQVLVKRAKGLKIKGKDGKIPFSLITFQYITYIHNIS